MANKPSREEVEIRAYEIYLERGGQNGNELDHWLAAEEELTSRASRSDASLSDAPVVGPQNQKAAAAGANQRPADTRRT
jgi:hypothetical protein